MSLSKVSTAALAGFGGACGFEEDGRSFRQAPVVDGIGGLFSAKGLGYL